MGAAKRVLRFESWPAKPTAEAREAAMGPQPLSEAPRVPVLRLAPFLLPSQPRRFARVPTHAVGVHPAHRQYPRAPLNLPLPLPAPAARPNESPLTPFTHDILQPAS